jgi:ribosomal protein S18 acetylase RimI-like enzyme
MITCEQASTPDQIELARTLLREYEASLGISLCFQGFEAELASLPGDYAPPRGRLLLARAGDQVAGCGALRPIGPDVCEMKRLYLRDAFRGRGAGRLLAQMLLLDARRLGYRSIRLDTLPSMIAAISLYRSLGFREIAPYAANPVSGALFMEKEL